MAYTEHLTEGSHYLFLGTSSGRLFRVRFNCRVKSMQSIVVKREKINSELVVLLYNQ